MERLAGRVILLWGWRRALAALVAGAAAAFSQAPYDFSAICFLSFPVLVWLLDGASGKPGEGIFGRLRTSFAIGWWFGFGYFLSGIWWVGNALLVDAELFAWALPLAILGLPALLAVFYGIATALARLLWSDGIGRIAALAAAFGAAEWLRAVALTGFPWNAIGYAAMPVPELMQSLTVVGMTGMNVLAVFVFAAPALLAEPRHRVSGLLFAFLLIVAHAAFGMWRLSSAPAEGEPLLNLRIVQPSIDQGAKWDDAMRDRIFQTYLEMSAQPVGEGVPEPDVIAWPETAVPFLFTDRPEALAALGDLVDDGQLLLAGAVRVEGGSGQTAGRYYNSVLAIGPAGEIVDAVDKVHLVPFGEYIPLAGLLGPFGLEQLARSVGPFSAGSQRRAITVDDGVSALPFICYEIIFPGVAGYGGIEADMLVNLTNDAWFGNTPGPYQHFRQAQLRAVEAGRPLVRAANNGISGVIDAYGRIIDAFAVDAVGTMDVSVPKQRAAASFLASPPINGIVLLAFFMFAAGVVRLGSTLRRN